MDELDYRERGLIEIFRAFEFLVHEHYDVKDISFYSLGQVGVVYDRMRDANRRIHVVGGETPVWSIGFVRNRLFTFNSAKITFDISDYYNYFDCSFMKRDKRSLMPGADFFDADYNYLKYQAEFVKRYLMPVVRGEMWIDDLINLQIINKPKED